MQAGGWDVTLVHLGTGSMPVDVFLDRESGLEGELELPVNVLLLRRPGRTVLVDAGTGVLTHVLPALAGELRAPLRAHGVELEDVDLLVLTHLDADHVGGALAGSWPDDLRPALPNARIVALAGALEPPEGDEVTARVLELLPIEGLADGAEVAPGVLLRAAPGHAPGNAVVEIVDEPPLFFLGDTAHTVTHVEHPEWGRADRDRPTAIATRRRVLGEIAARGALVYGAHIPGPEPARLGFRWDA